MLSLARDLGVPTEVRPITRGELIGADELFFTGTAAEVSPIREIDGYVIGKGGRGPITERVQKAFFAAVRGTDSTKAGWLTLV